MFFDLLKSLNNKTVTILALGLIFVLSDTAFAESSIAESYVVLENAKIELQGSFTGGQFGSAIEYGDFNGDGFSDLFMGSPFASFYETQWNGAVTVIFGGENGINTQFSFYGENAGDQMGTSLAVGDFNGDNIDDLAVGAHNAQFDNSRNGKVYILYGGTDRDGQLSSQTGGQEDGQAAGSHYGNFVLNKADLVVDGYEDKGQFGLALFSADVDNDGIDDLIVGSPGTNVNGNEMTGAVYIYSGTPGGIIKKPASRIYGQSPNEKFGSSISAGDFNKDGKIDLAVGAYTASINEKSQAGRIYLYDNSLVNGSAMFVSTTSFQGNDTKSWFGFAMAVGDANGDNIDDLLVSSFPYTGNRDQARAYLYYGSSDFMKKTFADVSIEGPEGEALMGASLLLSDLNDDQKADLVIGAPGIGNVQSEASGSVYIIFTGEEALKPEYRIGDKIGMNVIHGEHSDDWFGYGLKSLDLNNDSMNDLLIGSRYSDIPNGINNGKVFALLGQNKPFGRIKPLIEKNSQDITRAKLVKTVINRFDLRKKKEKFLKNCYEYKEFCLFNFTAMSSFSGITMDPDLILYPDVDQENGYFSYINDATVLGLVNGYLYEENSPFHPDHPVTKIQALKVVLGAADLVPPKYKFELISLLGSYSEVLNQFSYFVDVDPRISDMWWYPRYLNFAVANGIIDDGDFFWPNDNISIDELNDMIKRTLMFLNQSNEKDQS